LNPLKGAVGRNLECFPEDFMLRLTKEEFEDLKFHFGTSRAGGTRKLPEPPRHRLDERLCTPCKGELCDRAVGE